MGVNIFRKGLTKTGKVAEHKYALCMSWYQPKKNSIVVKHLVLGQRLLIPIMEEKVPLRAHSQ